MSNAPSASPSPAYGWQRYQSRHLIGVVGTWTLHTDYTASANGFHRATAAGAIARFPFTGEGLQLRYGRHEQACAFDVIIDEQRVDTLHAHQSETGWGVAGPYFLDPGYHLLDIRSQTAANHQCGVDIDYMDVFNGPPRPNTAPGPSAAATDSHRPAVSVVLLSAPPTRPPTPTRSPPGVITWVVTVAYDANANGTADLDEGVQGVSVRVVSQHTGELLAGGLTDAQGALRLSVVSRDPLTGHIPLLGERLPMRPVTGGTHTQPWTVLLPPANHPAVIP